MKKKRKKLFSSAIKALSFGMVMLLLYITAIPVFHSHVAKTFQDNISENGEYLHSTDQCAVCDYLSHHHHQEFYLPSPVLITVPVTKPITCLSRSYAGIYKFTLQGFTNKGPPAYL